RFSKPLKTLGEGTYGTVYLCVDKAAPDGPCYVAIKSFKSQELEEQAKALAVREAKLLAAVRGHPNIVHLHHAYMTRSGQLYLVQEYVENSLAQQLEVHSPKGLPHGMACSIIRQLLEALAFMHSRSVTHRDIKMANVLLRNDGLAPAVQPGGGPGGLQPSDSTAEAQLTSYVVTRWYRSPEVLLEQPYNEGVDVWSVVSQALTPCSAGHCVPGAQPSSSMEVLLAGGYRPSTHPLACADTQDWTPWHEDGGQGKHTHHHSSHASRTWPALPNSVR
ncbi:protein kinase-like domain, partial [Haematococcus lacustris]